MRNGYADTARYLTGTFGLSPPLDRRQVYAWAQRRTQNLACQPFPPGPPFSLDAVAGWYGRGLPDRRETGRRSLARRGIDVSTPRL